MSVSTPDQKRVTSRTPRKVSDKSTKSGFGETAIALARNPLGIVALFQVLVEALAVGPLVIPTGGLAPDDRRNLVYFVIGFPILILCVFYRLVTRHHPKLYAPSDFESEETYLAVQQAQKAAPLFIREEPQSALSVPAVAAPSSTSKEETKAETGSTDIDLKPQDDWSLSEFKFMLIHAMFLNNEAAADEIERAYLSKIAAEDVSPAKDQELIGKAFVELTRIRFGMKGNMAALRDLVSQSPLSSRLREHVAEGFLLYKDYDQAAENFEQAEAIAEGPSEKIALLGRAAVARIRAGAASVVPVLLERVKALAQNNSNCELDLLKALRDIAEASGEKLAEIGAMERMVEIDPSDTGTRFQLAYKHAQIGHKDIALARYLEIPELERDATVWNNIGVEYEYFTMSSKSIAAYRKAEKAGETLAVSNLAERLLAAGFLEESRIICEKVMSSPSYNPNVTSTLSRIEVRPNEEDKIEAKLLENVRSTGDFYRLFGRAIGTIEPKGLDGAWITPDWTITITIKNGALIGAGSYEQSHGGLGVLLSGVNFTPLRKKVELKGKLQGRTVSGRITLSDEEEGLPSSLLGAASAGGTEFLMVVSDDESQLKFMERVGTGGPSALSSGIMKFYSASRSS